MLEQLAGRLKWERTGLGIRVIVPARLNWLSIRVALWLLLLPVCLEYLARLFLSSVHRALAPATFDVSSRIGFCAAALWLSWAFLGRTILTLTPAGMTVEWSYLGIVLHSRAFDPASLHDLRYLPAKWRWFKDMLYAPSKIQLDEGSHTRTIARGVTEPEARALIDRMMEVYNFPDYSAPDNDEDDELDD